MKTVKIIVCFILLFFAVGIVSAHSVGYNLDSGKTIYKEKVSKSYDNDRGYVYSKTIYVYGYDGKNYLKHNYYGSGYPKDFEDYYGDGEKKYSKPFSDPYWNSKDLYGRLSKHDYYNGNYVHSDSWKYSHPKQYYFKKVGYFGEYEKTDCYVNPPKNKLIYSKCPWT